MYCTDVKCEFSSRCAAVQHIMRLMRLRAIGLVGMVALSEIALVVQLKAAEIGCWCVC